MLIVGIVLNTGEGLLEIRKVNSVVREPLPLSLRSLASFAFVHAS